MPLAFAFAFRFPRSAHNTPFVVLGTFILWFGWYGFNCGSTLSFTGSNVETAAVVAMTTSIAAGTGGMVTLLIRVCDERFGKGKREHYDVPAMSNGILAGLVAVTVRCSCGRKCVACGT